MNAREQSGVWIVADGVHMASPGGPIEQVPSERRKRDHGEATIAHLRAADVERLPQPSQKRRLFIDIAGADGFRMRIIKLQGIKYAERAEGDDKRGQAQESD